MIQDHEPRRGWPLEAGKGKQRDLSWGIQKEPALLKHSDVNPVIFILDLKLQKL